jgi:hypothetical protein
MLRKFGYMTQELARSTTKYLQIIKMSKKKYFLYRDADALNHTFYELYDETFLLNKSKTLLSVADNTKGFKQWASENASEAELLIDYPNTKYAEQLRAEIHFTEFHQFEAFFVLLIANFQDLPHWLFLTTYSNADFKNSVKQFLNNDIFGLTKGLCNNRKEFINSAIYTGFIAQDKEATWDINIDNIFWLINRLAKKYIEAPEYNAYKHGLRVIAGTTAIKIYQTDNPANTLVNWQPKDALRLLELQKINSSHETVRVVTKQFNPTESINHLYIMNLFLNTMKHTRLAYFKNKKDVETLHTFFDLDREKIEALSTSKKWSITV